MSDLRGLSTPPKIETGDNTAKFVSAFVVAAVAVGAAGYAYKEGHVKHPAQQTVAMNEVRTAALPSALSRVAPPMVSPAPAPAMAPNPITEPTAPKHDSANAAPVKAPRTVRTAHANSESFANRPASDTPSGNDTTRSAPALNTAPEQPAPQDSQTPAQNTSPQTPPTTSQPAPTPDPAAPQNSPDQQTPQQPQ